MEKGQKDSNEKDLDLAKYSKYNDLLKPKKTKDSEQALDMKKPSLTKFYVVAIVAILIGAYAFSGGFNNGGIFHSNPGTTSSKTFQGTIYIYNLCVNMNDLKSKSHYTLLITYQGIKYIPVPVGVGFYQFCTRALNVPTTPSIINVDIPNGYNGADPTISDFFRVWGVSVSGQNIGNYTGPITFSVNHQVNQDNWLLYTPPNGSLIQLAIN